LSSTANRSCVSSSIVHLAMEARRLLAASAAAESDVVLLFVFVVSCGTSMEGATQLLSFDGYMEACWVVLLGSL